jgi:hypothetical protein
MVKYRNDFDWLYTYGLALDYLQPGQNAQDCWTLRTGCQLEIASHNVAIVNTYRAPNEPCTFRNCKWELHVRQDKQVIEKTHLPFFKHEAMKAHGGVGV